MARITVEDCIDKFESRFELVLVASNRARKLHSGESPTVEKDNDKPTVIALREIADESVSVDSLKDKLIQEYQTVSPIDEEELSLDYDGSVAETKEEINEDDLQFSEVNEKTNYFLVFFVYLYSNLSFFDSLVYHTFFCPYLSLYLTLLNLCY